MSFGVHEEAVSPAWRTWRRRVDLDEYEARWDRLAEAGEDVHGEADLVASYVPSAVLDAGCGMGRLAIELDARGIDVVGVDLDDDLLARARRRAPGVTWVHHDLATVQLDRRFDVVAMPGNVMVFCRPVDRRAILHNMTQHLLPGGVLVAGFTLDADSGPSLGEYEALCADCDLTAEARWSTWDRQPFAGGDYAVCVHRRTRRFTVHDLVAEARSTIRRVTPAELDAARRTAGPPTVIDIRSHVDRQRFGTIEGSLHLPRTVVEWRMDPANGFTAPGMRFPDQPLVVVCNRGYSSSLAAAHLRRLGWTDVADLVGGMGEWRLGGFPVVAPDHSFLDF